MLIECIQRTEVHALHFRFAQLHKKKQTAAVRQKHWKLVTSFAGGQMGNGGWCTSSRRYSKERARAKWRKYDDIAAIPGSPQWIPGIGQHLRPSAGKIDALQ